jgi:hypothetical protein
LCGRTKSRSVAPLRCVRIDGAQAPRNFQIKAVQPTASRHCCTADSARTLRINRRKNRGTRAPQCAATALARAAPSHRPRHAQRCTRLAFASRARVPHRVAPRPPVPLPRARTSLNAVLGCSQIKQKKQS